ncbi:MAG: aldehyde dehydrogenase family protein [Paracoccaceae bacterium]
MVDLAGRPIAWQSRTRDRRDRLQGGAGQRAADADRAVMQARVAFADWTVRPVAERIAVLKRLLEAYNDRYEDFAQAMSAEMGADRNGARAQPAGQVHIEVDDQGRRKLPLGGDARHDPDHPRGDRRLHADHALNWPMNQIACKVAPALVAGCTMVLKPSEIAPLSAVLPRSVTRRACSAGVFNLINGTGQRWGARLSSHPRSTWCPSPARRGAGTAVAGGGRPR